MQKFPFSDFVLKEEVPSRMNFSFQRDRQRFCSGFTFFKKKKKKRMTINYMRFEMRRRGNIRGEKQSFNVFLLTGK